MCKGDGGDVAGVTVGCGGLSGLWVCVAGTSRTEFTSLSSVFPLLVSSSLLSSLSSDTSQRDAR